MKRILIFAATLVVACTTFVHTHAQVVTRQQFNDSLYKYMTGPQIDTCDSCISNQTEGGLLRLAGYTAAHADSATGSLSDFTNLFAINTDSLLGFTDSLAQHADSVANSLYGGGGSVSIGNAVGGGDARDILFINDSGNLAQDDAFFYDGINMNNNNGGVVLGKAGGITGAVQMNGATAGTVTVQPYDSTGNWTFYLPQNAGTNGQVLTSNGTNTSWKSAPVTSVSNADGSITVSPTTGSPVVSLNAAHTNTFTAAQNFSSLATGNAQLTNTSNSNLITLASPVISSSYSLILPTSAGSTHQLLHTDGAGNASWSNAALTTDVSGTLPIANGGTNATAMPTAGAVAYGTGSAFGFSSAGSSGQYLTSSGSGSPAWTTIGVTAPATFSGNTIGVDTTAGKKKLATHFYVDSAVATVSGGGGGTPTLNQVLTAGSVSTMSPTVGGITSYGSSVFNVSGGNGFTVRGWTASASVPAIYNNAVTPGSNNASILFDNGANYIYQNTYFRNSSGATEFSFDNGSQWVNSSYPILINTSTNDGNFFQVNGNISLQGAGNKLIIKSGTNSAIGTTMLSSGSATVSTTAVTANSLIYLSLQSCGSCGTQYISAKTAGVSFKISSSNPSDSSTVGWIIVDKQ